MGKMFIYGGITIGSLIGSYIPVWLFHVDAFSAISIIGGALGSFVGLWAGYKANQNFGE
jgi:hypothetical protein